MIWTAVGESVTGTSHRVRNVSCQDAFRFCALSGDPEWLLIVAADGAGSASHSELGATIVCDQLIRNITELKPATFCSRESVIRLIADVRATLVIEAENQNVSIRELACTAMLALVGPDSATFAQIGDGAIVFGQGQEHRVVFWPEPAEYANATDFLTDDAFGDTLRFESMNEMIDEVAVLTDGLQRLALDFAVSAPHEAFFGPLFKELRSASDAESLVEPLRTFLDSDRVNERTDDDKTLVLAVRRK